MDSASTQGATQVAPRYNLRSRVNWILRSRANYISLIKQGIAREQGVAKEVLSLFSFGVSATSGSGGLLCSRMSRRGDRNFQDKDDQRGGRDGGKPYRSISGSLGTLASSVSSYPAAFGSQAQTGQRRARLSKRMSPRRSPERRVVHSSPRRTVSTPSPRRIVHVPASQQRERSSGTWAQPSWTRPPTRPPTRAEDAKLKKKTKTKMKTKLKTKSKMKMPLGQKTPSNKKEALRAAKAKCARCRQWGHFRRDCPVQRRPQTKFPTQDQRPPPEMGTCLPEGPRPMAPYPPQDVPFNQTSVGPRMGMMDSPPMPHFTGFGMSPMLSPMMSPWFPPTSMVAPMMSPWFPTTSSMAFGTPFPMFQPTMPYPSSSGMTTPMMFNGKIGPRQSFRGIPPMG